MESLNPITDEWIKKKLNITTDNLEDIKSLLLPGSYQEKIVHLGDALYKFSRLRELDLSRNSIVSLDGLENLKYLEKLNLYYNCINSLKELEKLSHNKNLIEIDLRLNPVTKEETDYRLFLINILPGLKVVDDREIKDAERQMALTYYDNKNLKKPTAGYELYQSNHEPVLQSSRVKTVSNMVKRSAGIINEPSNSNSDIVVQNYISSHVTDSDNEYSRPRSSQQQLNKNSKPGFEQYSPKTIKELGEKESRELQRKSSLQSNGGFMKYRSASLQDVATFEKNQDDKNLQYADEPEAYGAFKSRATFTPNPQYGHDNYGQENEKQRNFAKETYNSEDEEIKEILADQKSNPIFNLLDLVDRYWNGTKSLHKNFKFLGQANQLLTQYSKYSSENNPLEMQINLLQTQLKTTQEDNRKLQQQIQQLKQNKENEKSDSEAQTRNYINEIDNLKKKMIIYQEENKRLRQECAVASDKRRDYSIDSMETDNENLKRDVEVMKIKLKQYEQLQQLTAMLQESHKSLLTTNEHLLREINDQKTTISSSQAYSKQEELFDEFDLLGLKPSKSSIQLVSSNVDPVRQKGSSRKHLDTLTNNLNSRHIYSSAK